MIYYTIRTNNCMYNEVISKSILINIPLKFIIYSLRGLKNITLINVIGIIDIYYKEGESYL